MYKVIITDYYYPNLNEERKVFEGTGIEIIDCKGKCKNEEDVIRYTKNADAIITQFVPITKEVIGNLKNCKIIVRYAIGLDNIDIAEATKKKIMVANVPDYCIEEVSNQALTLMLAVLRKLTIADRETRKGNCSYENTKPLYRLSKMNLGIIAFGRIAREFVKKAEVLGFKNIFIYDPYFKDLKKFPNYKFVSLKYLLENSNIISIHAPSTKETKHLINKKTIKLMKNGVYLINTSRGDLINENDLFETLRENKFSGVGLDVLSKEEIEKSNPLLQFDNVILTPHMGWYSVDSIKELQRKVAEQIKKGLLEKNPDYCVNREVLD
ncbi:C-terminal binding protein [Candidatus Atribacteria bacterium 1244-E10-H5-B2]|nr:MAG: C-terminal binding protein [Candidatus Atribacteria bacterium 1244-E10-H5-B2]